MARVLRTDVGTLRKPERTPQGFLRVDGHATKSGIFEYYRNDESTGFKRQLVRELRLDEEVFSPKAMSGYEGASFIESHPVDKNGEPVKVTVDNVKSLELGTVTSARRDGDHVAISTMVKDKKAIKKIESGKTALSVGYAVDLEESPGVHPKFGRYDAIQRNIVVNHVALVDSGRAGESARFRMDDGTIDDGMIDVIVGIGGITLTDVVDGHQHTFGADCASTTWAMSDGSDTSHSHDIVRAPDGSITLTENAGHTHGVIGATTAVTNAPRGDHMDPEKQAETIRALNESNRALEARAVAAEETSKKETLRADTAHGEILVVKGENEVLRTKLASQVAATETEAYRTEKLRADAAEIKVARFDETFEARVKARTSIMNSARVVMGNDFRMDDLSDRQIMASVVQRCDSSADVSKEVADGVIAGQFSTHVKGRIANAKSQANAAEIMADASRADSAHTAQVDKTVAAKRQQLANRGRAPLPNSREAQKRKDS